MGEHAVSWKTVGKGLLVCCYVSWNGDHADDLVAESVWRRIEGCAGSEAEVTVLHDMRRAYG